MNENRAQYWATIISEQEASGRAVRQFCRERSVGEHSFYIWRARLRGSARQQRQLKKKEEPLRFALVESAEPSSAIAQPAAGNLELHLPSGERLRIERGVDAGTLCLVLEALRR